MRLAWLGAVPTQEGVPYVSTQLLEGLADCGVEVDCFFAATEGALPEVLRRREGLRFFCLPPRSPWRIPHVPGEVSKFLAGQTLRAAAQSRLPALVVERHRVRAYDAVYQFSQIEMFSLRRYRSSLPPIVLHPEVHAAGELRWHRREAALARKCESPLRTAAVRAMLTARAWMQKRDAHLARMLIVPSRRFADHMAADYRLDLERLRVVPNPINAERFRPAPDSPRRSDGPVVLVFAGRMSVRKGVEMVVALSHRLSDLEGHVRIEIVGGWSMWSDYRNLLSEINPRVATYLGPRPYRELPLVYRSADGLIQPSHYEPFGLTVGEALASGLPVVAGDEVGAAEGVDPGCCLVFPSGDLAAFESAVRCLVERLRGTDAARLRWLARREARRLFSPSTVTAKLIEALDEAVSEKAPSPAGARL